MTVATVIYYSGYDPYTLKKVPTARSEREKKDQHRFFFWYKRENADWIRRALQRLKRPDLLEKLLERKSASSEGDSARHKRRARKRGVRSKRR